MNHIKILKALGTGRPWCGGSLAFRRELSGLGKRKVQPNSKDASRAEKSFHLQITQGGIRKFGQFMATICGRFLLQRKNRKSRSNGRPSATMKASGFRQLSRKNERA